MNEGEVTALLKNENDREGGSADSADYNSVRDRSQDDIVDATRSPVSVEMSRVRLFMVTVEMLGMSCVSYLTTVGVIPSQVLSLVGSEHKGSFLAAVVSAGGVTIFVISPLIGTCSDRLETRFGRRSPIIMISSVLICIVLFGMAWAAPTFPGCQSGFCDFVNVTKPLCHHNETSCLTVKTESMLNYGFYFVAFMAMSGLWASISVAWNGLIGDITPRHLRGFVSGMNGLMTLLGNGLGALWTIYYRDIGVWQTYALMSSVLFICSVITVIGVQEVSSLGNLDVAHLDIRRVFQAYWRPLKDWDFVWVFLTRFFMQMGVYTFMGYQYYWLYDVVDLPHCMSPETATGLLSLLVLVTGAICGPFSGHLSDRWQRRKPFVLTGGLVMAVCCGFSTWIRTYYVIVGIGCLLGLGYGLYITVDYALLLDVLLDEASNGNDMAVWHQSLILPQFLAVPIAGVLVDGLQHVDCKAALGYVVLFVVAALYFTLGGLFILMVRKVR